MEILLNDLKSSEEGVYSLTEENPSSRLGEIGCIGKSTVKVQKSQIGDKFWLRVNVEGGFNYECGLCGGKRPGRYKIAFKIMVEPSEKSGINWNDETEQNYDDYWVEIGPEIEKIPISSLIREQVLLNCNPARPREDLQVETCRTCGGKGNLESNSPDNQEIDPRWEKLKVLLKQKEK